MNLVLEQLADYHIVELPEPNIESSDNWGTNWFPEIDQWCEETYGPSDIWGNDPQTGWKRMRNKYFFTDENKRTWFTMRWE